MKTNDGVEVNTTQQAQQGQQPQPTAQPQPERQTPPQPEQAPEYEDRRYARQQANEIDPEFVSFFERQRTFQNGYVDSPGAAGYNHRKEFNPITVQQMLRSSRFSHSLSKNGQDYKETLSNELASYGIELVHPSEFQDGVYLALNRQNNCAVVLIFNELQQEFTDDEFMPACMHLDRIKLDPIYTDYVGQNGIQVIDGVVIPSTDYEPVGKMVSETLAKEVGILAAKNIKNNLFLGYRAPLSYQDLQNFQMKVSVSEDDVRQALFDHSPSGVLGHYQIGFRIDINLDPKNQYQVQYNNWKNEPKISPWEFLCVCTAYVEFLCEGWDGDRLFIQPVVTISNFESPLQSPRMLPLMLAVAHSVFIQGDLWKQPFRIYGKSQPNLGSLAFNRRENAVEFVNSQQEFEEFIVNHIGYPLLAVDYRYGAFNHACVRVLEQDPKTFDNVINAYVDGGKWGNFCPSRECWDFVSGAVMAEGSYVDSRAIDYFTLIDKNVVDPELLVHFRTYFDNPIDRIKAISEAGWVQKAPNSVRTKSLHKPLIPLYMTRKYIFDPDLIAYMMQLKDNMKIINSLKSANDNLAFDFGRLDRSSKLLNDISYRSHGYSGIRDRFNNYDDYRSYGRYDNRYYR